MAVLFDRTGGKSLALAAALGALCALALAASAQSGAAVSITGFKFAPATVSVAANTPITWTNNDGAPHQVVIASKNLRTPVLQKGQSAQLVVAEKGSVDYVCGIQPSMRGTIDVK
jgi:plastocyanin